MQINEAAASDAAQLVRSKGVRQFPANSKGSAWAVLLQLEYYISQAP